MFSTVILMNIVNGALFMGLRVRPRVILGAGFGIVGIAAIFWAEVSGVGDNADTWRGLWMCLLAKPGSHLRVILSPHAISRMAFR